MNIYITGHKIPDLDSISASVSYAEFLTKQKRYPEANIVPVLAGEPNKETLFVFNKFGVEMPTSIENVKVTSEDAFILVDHNEEDQRHEKVVANQVIEIIDHHKIKVSFTSPVRIDVKPLGSTSSLILEHFKMSSLKPSKEVSGLILSAILSDTVGLKSSTTTGYDSEIAHNLSTEQNLDLEKLTFEIFKAKSDLSGLTSEEIVTKDYKIFDFGTQKVFIGQVETVEPTKLLEDKNNLTKALQEIKAKEGVGQAYLVITDILKVNSHILFGTEQEKRVVESAFTTVGTENSADIGPRMSRKKDIAPAIEKILA